MVVISYLWRFAKWLLVIAALLAAAGVLFVRFHPTFGGKPDKASLAKIHASPNFNGGLFENIEPTAIDTTANEKDRRSLWQWLMSVTNPPAGKRPKKPLPSRPVDMQALTNNRFVWLGHSTLLMKLDGKTVLTDPVFNRASPVFFGGTPFDMTHRFTAAEMPAIDAVLISHDHYDHLDYQAVKDLNAKTAHFYVPLGVKAHLQRWGVDDGKITELDWHETATLGGLSFTLAPSRHYGGRNLNNRFTTLWGAWVIKSPELSVYFNGDSGPGKHFAMNAEKYGGFDIAFMENGGYNKKNWANIHMSPEESVQAGITLNAKHIVPIHWAKFDLSYHGWKEPIERFMAQADKQRQTVLTPKLGEVFGLENPPQERWWQGLE